MHGRWNILKYIYNSHSITDFHGSVYLNFVTFWKCLLDIFMQWFLTISFHKTFNIYSRVPVLWHPWDQAGAGFLNSTYTDHRSQWPRGLRRRPAAAHLLRLWVRIPLGAWIFVCCECCVLLGRGLCNKLITHPQEAYRLWCIVVCDLETSWMRRPWPSGGCCAKNKQTYTDLSSYW